MKMPIVRKPKLTMFSPSTSMPDWTNCETTSAMPVGPRTRLWLVRSAGTCRDGSVVASTPPSLADSNRSASGM